MLDTAPYDVTLEWWWPWLTEVAIPSLGVLASTAVAIIAIVLATRDRRHDRKEQVHRLRTEFGALLVRYATDISRAQTDAVAVPQNLLTIAARLTPPMTPAIDWVSTEVWKTHTAIISGGQGGWVDPLVKPAEFPDLVERRVEHWQAGAAFDLSPLPAPVRRK